MVRLCKLPFAAFVAAAATAVKAPPPPVFGNGPMQESFKVWLSVWRNYYAHTDASAVPHLQDADLPRAFSGVVPTVVASAGGAAGGVVSEGMGYALLVEGAMALQGDGWAIDLARSLMRSWLGMVQGTSDASKPPLGGADKNDGSASEVGRRPYGVSAIPGLGPAGVATWKFPREECYALSNASDPCHGSATDGDEDAVFGMIYLTAALDYPDDLVDLVVRAVISFASADLGYPDLYRTLPDGQRVYVPKAGSQWGGLTPPHGKYKREAHVPDWCYAPAYFAPAHYRVFRDFVKKNWRPSFDKYLPPHLDGKSTSLKDLVGAFDGAVVAGYNILYYSSCESGSVSNWVGVAAPCPDDGDLSCAGVPWAHTPYVGSKKGECSASGTSWGSFGSDASRTPWRLAMDYVLYPEESEQVTMYGRNGAVDKTIHFNARRYLNRIVTQYKRYATCDGGVVGGCDCYYPGCRPGSTQAIMLSTAFEVLEDLSTNPPTARAPGLVCENVPNHGESWWAGFMSYPTFTAFVAPYVDGVDLGGNKSVQPLNASQSSTWLDTFANICDFRNFTEEGQYNIFGAVCQKDYFHSSQEVISTLIMSGTLLPIPEKGHSAGRAAKASSEDVIVKADVRHASLAAAAHQEVAAGVLVAGCLVASLVMALVAITRGGAVASRAPGLLGGGFAGLGLLAASGEDGAEYCRSELDGAVA